MNPRTPAACSGPSDPRLSGTAPPQNATSTLSLPSVAARLMSSASTVVVGGIELSGMSTSVVTPPAAAARVADAKPSHAVRPGSLTCTCDVDQTGQEHLVVGQRDRVVARCVEGQHRGDDDRR